MKHTVLLAMLCCAGCTESDTPSAVEPDKIAGPVYAEPGDDLQRALDLAATATSDRRLIIRSGIHQAKDPCFCLLALTARHKGVIVEGEAGAVLSARSPQLPDKAIVCHVIYCGDGLTSTTVIRNIKVTGAKGFVTELKMPAENYGLRSNRLSRGLFYMMDGGAAKIFGQSSPRFEEVEFVDNETNLCGGGVSIEQQGFSHHPVQFHNCRFVRNRCPGTGSAIDVLEGSAAEITNCLFVQNIANYGMEQIATTYGLSYNAEHGTGALTVFPNSSVSVSKCTFTANWNGADDRGETSTFVDCIFSQNNATDGSRPGDPYELDVSNGTGVRNCLFFADLPDLQGNISARLNVLDAPDPQFDENHVPQNPVYHNVGYRP